MIEVSESRLAGSLRHLANPGRSSIRLVVALLALAAPLSASAAIVARSPARILYTSSEPVGPVSACRIGNNSFVATWTVGSAGNADIVARRFDGDASASGSAFVVSNESGGDRYAASVGCGDPGFVVAWQDQPANAASNPARDKFDILARPYSAAGTALSGPAIVNSYTTGNQKAPDLCAVGDGTFMATWHNRNRDDIRVVNFSPGTPAVPLGEESIATRDPRDFVPPRMACNGSGRALVVWADFPSTGVNDEISARLFDSDAMARTDAFIVNADPTGDQDDPVACANGDGRFVVSWRSAQSRRSPGVIKARRVTSAGAPTGGGFEISAPDRTFSDLICGSSGTFATTSKTKADSPTAFATFVRANDAIVDAERRITTDDLVTDGSPPAIAGDADGEFAIVWRSKNAKGLTSVMAGIFERISGPAPTTTQSTMTGPTTTSTSSTSSTTMDSVEGGCGDAVPSGSITPTDALAILRAAVGLDTCTLCICDVDDSGAVTVTDALNVLRIAVGNQGSLDCPSC